MAVMQRTAGAVNDVVAKIALKYIGRLGNRMLLAEGGETFGAVIMFTLLCSEVHLSAL